MWTYRARATKVVDGDTVDLELDLGFRIFHEVRVRLAGVDTPEVFGRRRTPEGAVASAFTRRWLSKSLLNRDDYVLEVRTDKTGKYGRWIAVVAYRDQPRATLNDALIAEGWGDPARLS